jgi:hypothetical protein
LRKRVLRLYAIEICGEIVGPKNDDGQTAACYDPRV